MATTVIIRLNRSVVNSINYVIKFSAPSFLLLLLLLSYTVQAQINENKDLTDQEKTAILSEF